MTHQAKFGMSEGELEKIYDENLRRLSLSRFKAGQAPLYLDSQTKHFLPRAIDALTLCGEKRFKTKRKTIGFSRRKFEQLTAAEVCPECFEVIREALGA